MKPAIPGRLHAQGLDRPRLESPLDVVRHLGCVQSQLHDMALWSVARRTGDVTLAELQHWFDAGDVLRTHVLRPTWHLVAPDDIHWLQALTGPRVRRLVETTNRSIGLTSDVVDQGVAVIVDALSDGRPHTRTDLASSLSAAGLRLTGQAVAHVVMTAEVEALVASGPLDGKQHTYRLLPPGPPLPDRDELLAQVARRYAQGHGPVRDQDLAWWTSLTLTESRRAIELGGLRPLDVDGQQYWCLDEPVEATAPAVMLLSNFDEYISYVRDPTDFARSGGSVDDLLRGTGLLVLDGMVAGSWRRAFTATRVTIDVRHAPTLSRSAQRLLQAEAEAFGRFVEREPALRLVD